MSLEFCIAISRLVIRRYNQANVCVIFGDDADGDWSSDYRSDGTRGWSSCGVFVGGFEDSVDLFAFPENQQFVFGADVSVVDVPTRIDFLACADVAHSLLFGTPLELLDGSNPAKGFVRPMKKYWSDCWGLVFRALLDGSSQGVVGVLERQIVQECRGKSLKSLLKSIEY